MSRHSFYAGSSLAAAILFLASAPQADAQTIADGWDNPTLAGPVTTEASLLDGNVALPSGAWVYDTSESQVGGDSVKSTLPNRATSRIESTVEGPATLSFRWKVSAFESIDRVYFGIEEQGTLASIAGDSDGGVDWQQRTFEVDCGTRLIAWEFERYSSSPIIDRSAWIDELVVTPIPNNPALQNAVENFVYTMHSTDWTSGMLSGARNSTVAKTGPVDIGEQSTMMFEIEGPAAVSFDWGIMTGTDDAAELALIVDGSVYESIEGTRDLEEVTLEFGPGTHCLKFRFLRTYSGSENPPQPSEGYVDNLLVSSFGASPTLADAVDRDGGVYSNAWIRQTTDTHDGVDAVSIITPDVNLYRRLYVDLPDEAGLLTFWSKTQTEEDKGHLYVLVDGGTVHQRTGTGGWEKTEVNLPAGTDRLLQAIFYRTADSVQANNRAFLDQITFTAGANNFQPDLSIGPKGSKGLKGVNIYNTSGAGQQATFRAKARRPVGQYLIRARNSSSSDEDKISLRGSWSDRHFDVLFVVTVNGEKLNFTAALKTGAFTTLDLDPGAFETHEIWVVRKPESTSRSHKMKVTGRSAESATKTDTVKTKLLVRPR